MGTPFSFMETTNDALNHLISGVTDRCIVRLNVDLGATLGSGYTIRDMISGTGRTPLSPMA